MDLSQLFRKYGSDKDINGYTDCYHTLLTPYQNSVEKMVEIGIGTMIPGAHSSMVGYAMDHYKPGGSLRAWRDFFSQAQIYGIDNQPDTQFEEDRIKTFLGDSTSVESIKDIMDTIGKVDIILDDGSHIDTDQLKTLSNLFEYVKEGGFYIIEDIYPGSKLNADPKCLELYCKEYPYFFVGVKNNICVIYKKRLDRTLRQNF